MTRSPIRMIKKVIDGTLYSIKGLRFAFRHDKSFRMEVRSGGLFVIFGYLVSPLSYVELMFLVLSYFLILIAELINTSIERALERLHPDRHELIGASKDVASAAVFLAMVFAVVVAVSIVLAHGGIMN